MNSIVAPFLDLVAVHKSYGTNHVLRGFSAAFLPGRVAALVGPNGVGKTTVMRIAAGLQRADSGAIEGGKALYYGGFDCLPRKGRVNQLRRAVGLSDRPGDKRVLSKLSRGELHRVGLDLAFELAPDVLLLDEPWTALEPDAREELNERIRAAAVDRVIICSSHDLDQVARVSDDVVFIKDGQCLRKRRDEMDGNVFQRDELYRLYRETKQP